MNKKVIAVFNRDDSVSWCYCNKGDVKTIGNALILHHNDYNAAKSLVSQDIEEFRGNGYIRATPHSSNLPFRSSRSMLSSLKDEAKYFFLYDEIDGWIISSNDKKKILEDYLKRKEK